MKPFLWTALLPALLAVGCGDEFIAPPTDILSSNDKIFFNPLELKSGKYERRGISVMAPDGSGYATVTGDSCYVSSGPRNGRIAYVDYIALGSYGPNPSCRGKIIVMNTDGSKPTVIDSSTDADTFFEQKVYLSRDGSSITYVKNSIANDRSTIIVAPVNGGTRKTFNLGNLPGIGTVGSFFDYRPSPDGRRIALAMRDATLRVLDLNTGVYMTLATQIHAGFDSFDWSPDGTRLAYGQGYGDDWYTSPSSLDIVDFSGGDRRSLAYGSSRIMGIAWAPGGEQIVFSRYREGPPEFTDLWLAPLSGEKPTNLTRTLPGIGNDYNVYWPQWSSDGSRLLFSAIFTDPKSTISTMSMVIADLRKSTMSIIRNDAYNGFW